MFASFANGKNYKAVRGAVATAKYILGKADERFLHGQLSEQDLADAAGFIVTKLETLADGLKYKHGGTMSKAAEKVFKPAQRSLKNIKKHLEDAYKDSLN
ncbi:hypothetical protein GE061_007766 [Apolygus lucorum]|uniref:Uncharacterized protein n=1 Tax=Apolygus lucorum TaxID=248454 RepID=A0A8S9WPF6_APOLU|nr:hypothetical protein GE061_007766 [Apolygus lucorum]